MPKMLFDATITCLVSKTSDDKIFDARRTAEQNVLRDELEL